MKNVVITGSTKGLGLSMAREFLKAECKVTLSGRNPDLSDCLRKDLLPYSGQYQYMMCDVRKEQDIENLWRQSAEKWGQVDIWINNAGQNSPHDFCYSIGSAETQDILDTNIKGLISGSQIAARNMLVQGTGQIWNMEGLGSNNMIQPKTVLYGTSKHALTYFTKGLAMELNGTPVKAGRLSPGMMLTDFITKTPDGHESPVIQNQGFKFIFNTLADRPETVADFLVPRILKNAGNDAHIVWLTTPKTIWRFLRAPFVKRHLI